MNTNILNIRIKTRTICLFFLFATISSAHPPFDKAILPNTNISSPTNLNFTSASSTASNIPLLQPTLDLSSNDSKSPAANASPPSAGNDKQEESQKSYEGDGISSGQPPPGVDIKGADNSAVKKMIPAFVVGGILILLAGIAVFWALGRKHRRN